MNNRVRFALGLLVLAGLLLLASLYISRRNNSAVLPNQLKAADSQAPAAGICQDAIGATARVVLSVDGPSPRCIKVTATQKLEIYNESESEVRIWYNTLPELAVIAPRNTFVDTKKFGDVLELGVHKLQTSLGNGPEIWFVEDASQTKPEEAIRVNTPQPDQAVSSPIVISGEARGSWYFEAQFPIRLLDRTGKELGTAIATAQGEWMTTEFVPFTASLKFTSPVSEEGILVFTKSNPSDLPENADEYRMPVRFAQAGNERSLNLYYYNQSKDKNAQGQVLCSDKGLVAVSRDVSSTNTPIQDAIRLLLLGNISPEERAAGITTEFPLEGFALKSANLSGGVLTLEFLDPKNKTSGGSCRTGILWEQIEATAKQFPEVTEVKFKPDTLFQP
jgi:hypothetical protein